MNAGRSEDPKREENGWWERERGGDHPHTSCAAKQKRPLRIGAELLLAERPSCSCVAACIRHYFPRQGGNLNRAGARHGSFTPPRISRSCVQEYHCKLTGSWRGQPAKAAFDLGGYRSAPYHWPSFMRRMLRTGGPRAPGLTLAPSAKVFKSPDMTAWAVFFRVQRDRRKSIPSMWVGSVRTRFLQPFCQNFLEKIFELLRREPKCSAGEHPKTAAISVLENPSSIQ